jgi:hypothetical protein
MVSDLSPGKVLISSKVLILSASKLLILWKVLKVLKFLIFPPL